MVGNSGYRMKLMESIKYEGIKTQNITVYYIKIWRYIISKYGGILSQNMEIYYLKIWRYIILKREYFITCTTKE